MAESLNPWLHIQCPLVGVLFVRPSSWTHPFTTYWLSLLIINKLLISYHYWTSLLIVNKFTTYCYMHIGCIPIDSYHWPLTVYWGATHFQTLVVSCRNHPMVVSPLILLTRYWYMLNYCLGWPGSQKPWLYSTRSQKPYSNPDPPTMDTSTTSAMLIHPGPVQAQPSKTQGRMRSQKWLAADGPQNLRGRAPRTPKKPRWLDRDWKPRKYGEFLLVQS